MADQSLRDEGAPGGASEEEVLRRKWFYRFRLPSGAVTESYLQPEVWPIHDTRERMLFSVLDSAFSGNWPETRCIDVACHEGYYSSLLAQRGCKSVLGIDGRAENVAGARLMRDVLGLRNLTFEQADVTRIGAARFGQFDIVLVLGLLYHLENPVGTLRLARALSQRVAIIETQLAPPLPGDIEWGSVLARKPLVATFGVVDETFEVTDANREANLSTVSLVPDLEGLLWMLRTVGFSRVDWIPPFEGCYEQFARGQRAMVAAWV
jgi:tRNA (mo5U34)-methyltransferase